MNIFIFIYLYIYTTIYLNIYCGNTIYLSALEAGSGMLRVQRPELLSLHGFVLFASVGMLCARVPHRLEKRPPYAL